MDIPLAERMRPLTLEDYIGQEHLVGKNKVLRNVIESGKLPSFILWGPPGVGKTTLANVIANVQNRTFFALSAINSGVKDIRDVIEQAKGNLFHQKTNPIVFIDEIHRFSKSQQDALLNAVEKGIITLIGATTENPSFEVIPALLSRCQVYVLEPLHEDDLIQLIQHAITKDEWLRQYQISIDSYDALLRISGGDARKLLNALELVVQQNTNNSIIKITDELVVKTIQQNIGAYDKSGENHYNIISAFIKSVRSSDPNAALYYLARMISAGEDPIFICRRMVILASEDIGLANPNALLIATSCLQAVHQIGMPEGRIVMSETAIYLSCSAKSNSAYMAIEAALDVVRKTGDLPVPLHLRNAVTSFMKDLDYGKDYKYAHDFQNSKTSMECLPEKIMGSVFYNPGDNIAEDKWKTTIHQLWGDKYKM
ncbi:MAG: replication-associated recombination protein A [Saprospiraceae bacterium]|nr:replication-associated recombination protein A [Saprospiraceae bacterium]